MRKFHIILFLLIWNFSFAQEYTNFSVAEGLPSNHVYRLVQDKQGFIWVLTDKGMARFNGTEFKTFTTRDGLPTNDIWDIRIGPDNKLWYFSKSSTLGYILNDSVHNFPSCSPSTVFYPSRTFQMGNTFVFKDGDGVTSLIDGCWQKINNVGEIKLPLETRVILSEKGRRDVLAYLHSSVQEILDIDEADWMDRNTRFVSHDSLLVMIYNDGYNFYNINDGRIYSGSLPIKLNPQYAYFNRITFANEEIQIAGFGYLAPLNKDYTISEFIQIPDYLQSHYSFRDRTGNIWAATFANGIYMLPQIKREIVYLLQGKKVKLFCTETEPVIANVLDDGFYEYHKDSMSFKQLVSEKGFIYSAKYIPELKTNYLISESHIFLLNQKGKIKKVSNKEMGLKDLSFCNGTLYGIISSAIMKLDAETLDKLATYEQNGVMDLIQFQNKLVLGTSNGLIYMEKGITHVINAAELFQKPILKLFQITDNLLLVCTDGFGAYLTDFEKAVPLPGSEYLSIESAFIEDNEIWLTSEVGVLHYSKIGENYHLVEKLDENNGLLSKRINSIVVLEKEIMLGTDNGVVIIPKNQIKVDQVLDVYFAAANFNSQSLLGENKNFRYASNNDLTIEISSIDYSQSAENVGFEYKLLPIQKEWSNTTSKEIHFTDLSPNKYEVWIKKGGIEKSISFSILPLWWQRSVSKAGLVFLLVLLVTAGIYKYQKVQIKKRFKAIITQKKIAENELYALRAQMNPHFVFNSLASIQYYINENNFEISEKYLVKFSKLIRQFFELSKQEEVTLETEIKLLENYLDIEQLRFKEKLEYHIKLDPFLNLQETTIPTMLLQPIVENAVNHGIFNKVENGQLDLNFHNVGQNEFIVDIVDNGVGFVNSKKKTEGRISSSSVLQNRLDILNRSNQWSITFSNREAFPEAMDVGNISTFKIKKIE